MKNEIKFIQLLPKTRTDLYEALFEVGDKDIKVGISHTLLAVWKIGSSEESIISFMNKFGILQIELMLTDDCLGNYKFTSDKFLKADQTSIKYEELENYFKSKILKIGEKSKSIGFI